MFSMSTDPQPQNVSKSLNLDTSMLPLTGEWDVVVVGGGPSGCAAAVGAASTGSSTLLIEKSCSLGGMGTIARVPAWCPFSDKKQQIHKGFAGRILERSLVTTPHVDSDQLDWVPISFEDLKRIYDEEVSQSGAEVRFDTLLVDVVVDDAGVVEAILVADKTGLHVIRASIFIDCTGDADLVHRTGTSMHIGDDQGGEFMPATMCFTLANVRQPSDGSRPEFLESIDGALPVIEQIRQDPAFAEIPDNHICRTWTGPGCMSFNAGHIYDIDNTDPTSITRGVMEGRHLASLYRDGFAKYLPDFFSDAVLIATGSVLGVRETRRIIADVELTLDDYLHRRSFPDEISRNAYFIDIHLYSDEVDEDTPWEEQVHNRFEKYQPGESHGIPYRCLCPKDLKNVLVGGRCIGTDREVNASVRVMPVCLSTGEAAGVAATMARNEKNVHRISTETLRNTLKERGAYLP